MIIQILLFILKLLLGILLFVLLALLYIVFFPWSITAKAAGDSQQKEITGNVRITGFLHFWTILVDPKENELISVKALWGLAAIYPRPEKKSKKKIKDQPEVISTKETAEEVNSDNSEDTSELANYHNISASDTEAEIGSETDAETKAETDAETEAESDAADADDRFKDESASKISEKERGKITYRIISSVSGIFQRIAGIIKGVFQSIRSLFHNIADMDIPGKLSKVTEIITAPENTAAVKVVLGQLSWLIKKLNIHLKDTHIEYGFDDPMTTGQICAVLSVLPVVYEGDSEIVPDFTAEEIYIRGKAGLRLRFAAWYLLYIAWKLWRDKNTNKVIKKFLNR